MSDFAARHAVLAAGYGARDEPDDPALIQAMPIVLHLPKQDPPKRSAVLEAAAASVVALCLDERVGVNGPWETAFRNWVDVRIRKVARRARGAHWLAAQEIDGITVDIDGAQARALVPGPVGELDPRIKRLQVGGTDLEHDDPAERTGVPVLWVNSALDMTLGKTAAQVGHASMLLAAAMTTDDAFEWSVRGFDCAVRQADSHTWAKLAQEVARGAAVGVRDAGFTEVAPGSMTVVAMV
ncbi:peptidyl-tRNA hydrolase [Antrihabitans sp. YC3-6]|uniref:peptidyl-tRNA hydrolase n=1 Tax=Antrihabitans stalagmiti TaxID=2799499 RepID=A0A934NMX9_9NOCA|nr:aminoacyl-tRNA hydrolase [Antrihabitans stalagmiti]MBJ8338201.1 peptidyl-tRNA hydrolase [Antrihabitans stalagmiti]